MSDVMAVAAGAYHTIVVKEDGTLWTTGWNVFGQLADGTTTDRNEYVVVARNAKAVAAGVRHTVMLKQDSSVWTTICNVHGQVGDFSGQERGVFIKMMSGGAKTITAGGYHSMVFKQDGTLWVAGSNKNGQIGYGGAFRSYRDSIRNFVRVGLPLDGAIQDAVVD